MITTEQVVEILENLPDDKDNPMEYDTCLYTDPYDYDNHCIAGEVLSRLGYRLPDPQSHLNEAGIYELVADPLFTLSEDDFDPIALKILAWAQESADKHSPRGEGNAWGIAKTFSIDLAYKEMRG